MAFEHKIAAEAYIDQLGVLCDIEFPREYYTIEEVELRS